MSVPPIEPSRWAELSPLLDELLELPQAERRARLAELRQRDPALADELAPWVGELARLEHSPFLREPALPAPADLAGQVVGAYTLVRELGRGGMGSAWLARRTDGRFEGEVAIKFLASGLFSAAASERFAREGSIMARLAHPHIARLLDAGHLTPAVGPPQPYLVMEYVPGEPIDAYCQQRALPVEARLRLFLDVLDAVAHAHSRLILHRDLKPANILVTVAGEVKLLDFGIAKLLDAASPGELTQQAGNAFTPQYAAPEQVEGGEVTTGTDVFALGVLLHLLLSDRLPWDAPADNTLSAWQAVWQREPPRVSQAALAAGPEARGRARELRGDLDVIVARALKRLPAERYASAAALATDLRHHLAHEPISARSDSWSYRSARFLRRHRVAVGAGVLAAAALSTSAGVALYEARQARQQQEQAEGLIEFMLGDLPAKLKPVGRLDALDAVGDRALAYYAAQAPGSLDAASLGRRARALHLMGEITEQTGRLDDAARRFAEAAASTGELLARHPNDAEHVFNHAQSEYWVGFVARRRGLPAEAERAFLSYQALAQQLARLTPDKLDGHIEVAYAGHNLGVLQLEGGRPDDALASFERTRQAWQAVVPKRPAMALDLADTLGWIAKAHEARNDASAAIAALGAAFAALDQVPDAARDRDVQRLAGVGHYDFGRLLLAQGQAEAALESLKVARGLFEGQVRHDPQNMDWLAQLAATWASQAEIESGTRAGEAALAELQRLTARLLSAPQRKLRWWLILQGRLLTLRARAAAPGASAELQAWADEVARFEAKGQPLDAEQSRIAAAAGLALGDLRQREGRGPEAVAAWQLAMVRLQPGLQRREPQALLLAARLAWRRGNLQEAREWAEKLASTTYRHPDVLAMRKELSLAAAPGRS